MSQHLTSDRLLSAIVVGEGRTGAHLTSRPAHWIKGWILLTTGWQPAPFDALSADHYGRAIKRCLAIIFLSGHYARRLDGFNRVVYRIERPDVVVVSCLGYYGDS